MVDYTNKILTQCQKKRERKRSDNKKRWKENGREREI